MSPQRPDLVLASDVPDIEFGVLVGDGLYVEADGGDGRDVLIELELIQNGWKSATISDCPSLHGQGLWNIDGDVLVLPAASSPSINSRISLDPKILFIILDICPPMVSGCGRIRLETSEGALLGNLACGDEEEWCHREERPGRRLDMVRIRAREFASAVRVGGRGRVKDVKSATRESAILAMIVFCVGGIGERPGRGVGGVSVGAGVCLVGRAATAGRDEA